MKTNIIAAVIALLVGVTTQAAPKIRLVRGTWIEETFHAKGTILINWKLDRDWLTDQTRLRQTKWHNVYFDKMNGNPIRIISKGVYERESIDTFVFRPVLGEEIFVYLLDASGGIKEATTNQIPRAAMGSAFEITGNVGRLVVKDAYQKSSTLQKSTFEIDNTEDDRNWVIYFMYTSPVGGGTNVFPTITTSVGPFQKFEFTPTVTDGSLSVNRSIEWMQFYKIEGKIIR